MINLEKQKEMNKELKSLKSDEFIVYFIDEYGFSWSMYSKDVIDKTDLYEIMVLNMVPSNELGEIATLGDFILKTDEINNSGKLILFYLSLENLERYNQNELYYVESYQVNKNDKFIKMNLKTY